MSYYVNRDDVVRVLFIDHIEADYLSAMVFKGLCEELGPHSVVDWPYKGSLHGETDRYPNLYANPRGDPNLGGPEGVTSPFPWMIGVAPNGRHWSDDEVFNRIDEFDLVILAAPRRLNREALERLIPRVGRGALRRLVMIDGEDHSVVSHEHIARFAPAVYFKRELFVIGQVGSTRVLPCSQVAPWDVLPVTPPPRDHPRTIDVVFLGGQNCPGGKAPFAAAVHRVTSNCLTGYVAYSEFLEALASARIAISIRGHGTESGRFWEILAAEGTMLFADRQPILRGDHPLVDGVHCAYFDSPEELERKLRVYLTDEVLRRAVATNGYAHLRAHHTTRARARDILRESFR